MCECCLNIWWYFGWVWNPSTSWLVYTAMLSVLASRRKDTSWTGKLLYILLSEKFKFVHPPSELGRCVESRVPVSRQRAKKGQCFESKRVFLAPSKTGWYIFRMWCQNSVSWKWKRSIKSWQPWPQSQKQNRAKHDDGRREKEKIFYQRQTDFLPQNNIFKWSRRDDLTPLVWSLTFRYLQ